MSKFLHYADHNNDDDADDDAKAIAKPQIFSENSQAKKGHKCFRASPGFHKCEVQVF